MKKMMNKLRYQSNLTKIWKRNDFDEQNKANNINIILSIHFKLNSIKNVVVKKFCGHSANYWVDLRTCSHFPEWTSINDGVSGGVGGLCVLRCEIECIPNKRATSFLPKTSYVVFYLLGFDAFFFFCSWQFSSNADIRMQAHNAYETYRVIYLNKHKQ